MESVEMMISGKASTATDDMHQASAKDVRVLPNQAVRFDLSDPEQEDVMLKHLDEHGYAVIANVANAEEIELSKGMFWDFWEKAQVRGPIKRDDLESWKHWMANSATGILTGSAGGNHNDFSWNSRTLPGVKNAFAKVWQDDRLVVSFDASGAFRPYEPHKEWLTNGGWWHVDQNALRGPHRQGRVTVQGLVTYYDATEHTGGLCVIPGSHKLHAQLCERAPTAQLKKMDYVSVPKNDPVLSSAQAVLVCCRAGDLVLWDSRTVHCNTPALAHVDHFANKLNMSDKCSEECGCGEEKGIVPDTPGTMTALTTNNIPFAPPPELIRLVCYVCMVPRAHLTSTMLFNRKQAFVHKHGTLHYPHFEGCCGSDKVVQPWTKRRDILQLVGYTEREINDIQVGRDPASSNCAIS
jgi:ectoine hydroxylase-related dioxygenase (phytanoyl-CoA dioxygenase family)